MYLGDESIRGCIAIFSSLGISWVRWTASRICVAVYSDCQTCFQCRCQRACSCINVTNVPIAYNCEEVLYV